MSINNFQRHRGIVILYAVLLVSIVLTISLSLLNITYKQIILTGVSRESQRAHFAAWSALNCVKAANESYKVGIIDNVDNPFGRFVFSMPIDLQIPDPLPTENQSISFACGLSGVNEITLFLKDIYLNSVVTENGPSGSSATFFRTDYELQGSALGPGCANVTVVKVKSGDYDQVDDVDGQDDSGKIFITARGYNTSCGDSSSRRVERRARTRI